jgi:hypothetical protein
MRTRGIGKRGRAEGKGKEDKSPFLNKEAKPVFGHA